jgi:excisionase family DNA binding protein
LVFSPAGSSLARTARKRSGPMRKQIKKGRLIPAGSKARSLTNGENQILTKSEAAELLGCTTRYIERAVSSGRLRACKPSGKFVRIFRSDIDAFLLSGASIAA